MNTTIRVRDLLLFAVLIFCLSAFKGITAPTKWEVTTMVATNPVDMMNYAKQIGREGWELSTCYGGVNDDVTCFFKRPLP